MLVLGLASPLHQPHTKGRVHAVGVRIVLWVGMGCKWDVHAVGVRIVLWVGMGCTWDVHAVGVRIVLWVGMGWVENAGERDVRDILRLWTRWHGMGISMGVAHDVLRLGIARDRGYEDGCPKAGHRQGQGIRDVLRLGIGRDRGYEDAWGFSSSMSSLMSLNAALTACVVKGEGRRT